MKPLTVEQVCERLSFKDRRTVIAAIKCGDLRAARVGTGKLRPEYRITEADLADFIELRSGVTKPKKKRRLEPVEQFV